ncbi:hypothetical protein RHSIM_Rhsim02G0110500 [Rhododendron simsii]|uniref:Adenosine deaminase domain-containing protein n=1 Tax=Rhododendron simsii TaxID=118357 RepID=A0A834HKB4_RHOSS|nr:hypothetical protein RHSIM_Rhsim02G0110500 [Rhododendron simsii]
MENQRDMDWWVSMPKIELHAHLNGSIRSSTLLELAKGLGEKGTIVFSDVEQAILKSDRSLQEVFKLFDLIHMVTTDLQTVTRITKEVVEDFAAENVVYLELRTTPKKNDLKGMSKQSYMEAVVKGLRDVTTVEVDLAPQDLGIGNPVNSGGSGNLCNGTARKQKIYVRILLSIDRRETTDSAMETVKLALEMRHLGVTGIDLSGNPIVGEWATFLPALQFAREEGLSITLHCGEVPNTEEIQSMLDFLPGRIGHACCFGEEEWRKLKSSKIPVEICLTSNIRTETISSFDLHHFGCLDDNNMHVQFAGIAADLHKAKHPIVLCTDDTGVFSTSLSREYALAASTFGLGRSNMFQLAQNAIDFVFADDAVKMELREIFYSAETKLDF